MISKGGLMKMLTYYRNSINYILANKLLRVVKNVHHQWAKKKYKNIKSKIALNLKS